jgi:hypothetical protein
MRWVFLVAGFGAGLAVGLVLSRRETPRAARAPVVAHVGRAPRAAPRAEAPPPSAAATVAAPVVVEPTGDLSEDEAEHYPGRGWIEVDFEGFDGDHRAWIRMTALSGRREDEDARPDDPDTVVRFEPAAGVCDVWWLVGPRRVGTRVRVVEGRVVRVRAADIDSAVLPRDLAVLGVHVGATWGDSLPRMPVDVESGDESLGFCTDDHGCLNVTLRPGTATVRVGDQVTPVALEAGRETVLEVRHRAEGDVLFDPPYAGGSGRLGLRPVGARRATGRPRYKRRGRDGYLYVKAGEYEVFRTVSRGASGGTVLGTVQVLPGRASVFRVELPPGVLEVSVDLADEVARKTPYVLVSLQSVVGYGVRYVDQVQATRVTAGGRHHYEVRLDGLHPGRYRLVCGTAAETVEVADGVTKVVLRPPR